MYKRHRIFISTPTTISVSISWHPQEKRVLLLTEKNATQSSIFHQIPLFPIPTRVMWWGLDRPGLGEQPWNWETEFLWNCWRRYYSIPGDIGKSPLRMCGERYLQLYYLEYKQTCLEEKEGSLSTTLEHLRKVHLRAFQRKTLFLSPKIYI